MSITPDEVILYQWGWAKLNLTIIVTWANMLLLVFLALWTCRWIRKSKRLSRLDVAVETVVMKIMQELKEAGLQDPKKYLPFIGGLFLLLSLSAILTLFPWYVPPTSSLSTTAGLALCVFFAVPIFGIKERGFLGYLKSYIQPTPFMLPFNILNDMSKTLALAIRLFGNMMSGTKMVAILISIAPLLFPLFLRLLGLLTGMVQAYIFSILATVYLSAATRKRQEVLEDENQ